MINRDLENKILKSLKRSSSVVILGPRQVGKTTLSLRISKTLPSVYLDLEKKLDLTKVQDIHTFYENNKRKLIVLDEVQRLPEVFSEIRGIIDKERQEGNQSAIFLFLGSASMDLLKQSSESLAGRISFHELFTINILEIDKNKDYNVNQLWLYGGFPNSFLSKNDDESWSGE